MPNDNAVPEFTPGRALNTLNPFAHVPGIGGQYWMPDWFRAVKDNQLNKVVFRAGATGLTALTAAALGRFLFNQVDSDVARKKREADAKVMTEEGASDVGANPKTSDRILTGALAKQAEDRSRYAGYILTALAPVAAGSAGIIGGTWLADRVTKQMEAAKIQNEMAKIEKELQDVNTARLRLARVGPPKPEEPAAPPPALPAPPETVIPKSAANTGESTLSGSALSLAGLAAAAAALVGGYAGKRYADSVDPARAAHKEARDAFARLAAAEAEAQPPQLSRPDPETIAYLNAAAPARPPKPLEPPVSPVRI